MNLQFKHLRQKSISSVQRQMKATLSSKPSFKQIINNQYQRTPTKPPTSFRELSGSRDKNKLFSGKKQRLQNKLNTLRQASQGSSKNLYIGIKDNLVQQFGSGRKQGLFTKLLSSRQPCSVKKVLNFDQIKDRQQFGISQSKVSNTTSIMTFSAFKDITLQDNNNVYKTNNLTKATSAPQSQGKGLKFKNFPHKRKIDNQQQKMKSPRKYLDFGPLINDKSKSKNKSDIQNRQINLSKSPRMVSINQSYIIDTIKIEKYCPNHNHHRALSQINQNSNLLHPQYGLVNNQAVNYNINININKLSIKLNTSNQYQVIRSMQGSLDFDMSPTMF